MNILDKKNNKIAIIGLGYVGLPLAVEFGKDRPTIGFDTNNERIKELKSGKDLTLEVDTKDILDSHLLEFTSNLNDLLSTNWGESHLEIVNG